jgi:hypothetical protein
MEQTSQKINPQIYAKALVKACEFIRKHSSFNMDTIGLDIDLINLIYEDSVEEWATYFLRQTLKEEELI